MYKHGPINCASLSPTSATRFTFSATDLVAPMLFAVSFIVRAFQNI